MVGLLSLARIRSAHAVWPLSSAICNGFFPSFLTVVTLAPDSIKSLRHSVFPHIAAICAGVHPSLLAISKLAPAAIKRSMHPS